MHHACMSEFNGITNTSKNNENFETLQMYEHLLHTNIGLSNSKEAIFT